MSTAVAAIGTAAIESGWTPPPQRFTATFDSAAQSGAISSTAAAFATWLPPRAWRSPEKSTAMPPKPTRTPRTLRAVSRSAGSAKWAMRPVNSGVVAKTTAASPDGSHCSDQ